MLKALFIRIGLSSMLFMGVSLIMIYNINQQTLIGEIKELDIQQREELVSKYQESLARYENFLGSLNVIFGQYLVNKEDFTKISKNKIETILMKLNNTYGFVSVYLADLEGNFVSSDKYEFNVLETKRPWYMSVLNGSNFYQSEFYKSKVGTMVVTFAKPVTLNGKRIGVAGIDIQGDNFLPDSSHFVLTDKKGRVFGASKNLVDFLGKNVFEMRPAFANASQTPIFYKNPEGRDFTVTKLELPDGNLLYSALGVNDILERNNALFKEIVAIAFVGIFIIMLTIFFVLTNELKVIKAISTLVQGISEGNLKIQSFNAKYEFGNIAIAINQLTKKLSTVITQSQGIMSEIKSKQDLAVDWAKKNKTNSLNELNFVEEVKNASIGLAGAATEVASNAIEAEKATRAANSIIDTSQSILTNASKANQEITISFADAKNTVNQLREHSEKISTVVDVINNISEQTNLLALNAAIEAARAGAQGRGFAVVADEVRALAAKTQQSTVDIQKIITQLQDKSKQANDSMNQNVELVKQTQTSMDELKHSFEEISNTVSGIFEVSTVVAAASEEQNIVTQDISKQVENMNQLVLQNLEGIEQSTISSNEVSHLAERLQEELSFFKVS